ncbi:MAG: hypothetical protein ABIQ08_02095 [Duganella sp.]
MKRVSEKSAAHREKWGLFFLRSPEILFLFVLCGFGGVAARWLFIGVGALFALVPIIGCAVFYWAQLRRKRADVV